MLDGWMEDSRTRIQRDQCDCEWLLAVVAISSSRSWSPDKRLLASAYYLCVPFSFALSGGLASSNFQLTHQPSMATRLCAVAAAAAAAAAVVVLVVVAVGRPISKPLLASEQ